MSHVCRVLLQLGAGFSIMRFTRNLLRLHRIFCRREGIPDFEEDAADETLHLLDRLWLGGVLECRCDCTNRHDDDPDDNAVLQYLRHRCGRGNWSGYY